MLYKGTMITSASGRLGDLVASRNQGGEYFRVLGNPNPNPPTDEQLTCRQALTDIYAEWQGLSPEARQQWAAFSQRTLRPSRIGTYRPIGGYPEFTRANLCRFVANAALSQALPTVVLPTNNIAATQGDPAPRFIAYEHHSIIEVFYDGDSAWYQDPDSALLVWVSPQQEPTVNWYRSPMTLAACFPGQSLELNPYEWDSMLDLIPGKALFLKTRATMSHGGLSPEQWHRVIVQ